jgi:sugar phosphate isomerase/epimerase
VAPRTADTFAKWETAPTFGSRDAWQTLQRQEESNDATRSVQMTDSTVADVVALSRFSVCEFTTPDLSFEQDVELCREVGAAGLSVCEVKLDDPDRDEDRARALADADLHSAVAIPVNIGVLTCGDMFPGPEDVDDRVQAMCDSIRRLARFGPASIVVITGSPQDRDPGEARRIVVEGLREAARVAAEFGLRLSLETLRADGGLDLSIVNTITETLELIEEVGAPNLDIAYDVYHVWDEPDLLELTVRHADRIGGVHVCDWREPPRSVGDRLAPGEGTIDLPSILAALERGGFRGWYDLEIFSDKDLEDSLWNLPPRELVERGRDGFLDAWAKASQPPERSA